MDDDRKKPVMVVLVVAFLALAGGVTYWTQFRGGGQTVEAEPVFLKCQSCGYVRETNTRDLQEEVDQGKIRYDDEGVAFFPCPQCGKADMARAMKCEKCGEVFIPNYSNPRVNPDRCPKCKYSAAEEKERRK